MSRSREKNRLYMIKYRADRAPTRTLSNSKVLHGISTSPHGDVTLVNEYRKPNVPLVIKLVNCSKRPVETLERLGYRKVW